jgi:hypothetical protein
VATSLGWAMRRSGTVRSTGVRSSRCITGFSYSSSVSITPGCTELTRTPLRPSSRAATFVMPRTAHFVAEYPIVLGVPTIPAADEMLTMLPRWAAIIVGATARIPRNTPSWLTSNWRVKSSTVVSTMRA